MNLRGFLATAREVLGGLFRRYGFRDVGLAKYFLGVVRLDHDRLRPPRHQIGSRRLEIGASADFLRCRVARPCPESRLRIRQLGAEHVRGVGCELAGIVARGFDCCS